MGRRYSQQMCLGIIQLGILIIFLFTSAEVLFPLLFIIPIILISVLVLAVFFVKGKC